MTTAFLTGGTGFLGSRLAAILRAEGTEVRALARNPGKAEYLRSLGCEIVAGDLEKPSSFADAMKGCEAVYHVAAWYELGVREADAARMERANVGGTEAVLGAAERAGAERIVYCSSTVAYGPSNEPADESHRYAGPYLSHYQRTKAEAHKVAERFARRGVPVRIGAPPTIYGPDDPSLVGFLMRNFVEGKIAALARSRILMSLVHVEDAARGLRLVAERGKDGESYILSESIISIGDWIRLLCDVSGMRRPAVDLPDWLVSAGEPMAALLAPLAGFRRELVREASAMSGRTSWAYKGDKARRDLGWSPRPLAEGFAETLEWYRARYAPRRKFRPKAA